MLDVEWAGKRGMMEYINISGAGGEVGGVWGQHSMVGVLGMNQLYGCNCKKIMAIP